jgi:hypothetical protein
LGAIRWVAIVVVEGEAENFGEPIDGFGDVGVDDVGEDGVWRDGAIVDHWRHLPGKDSQDWGLGKRKYNAETLSMQRRSREGLVPVALRAQGRVVEEIALLE